MSNRYSRIPRSTPTGVATGSILLTTLAMAASLLFAEPVAQPSAGTAVVQSGSMTRS